MKYRTLENGGRVRLRRERRSGEQLNRFPIEDLNRKIIVEERRVTPDRRAGGPEVTDTNLSHDEFQKYFQGYHHTD